MIIQGWYETLVVLGSTVDPITPYLTSRERPCLDHILLNPVVSLSVGVCAHALWNGPGSMAGRTNYQIRNVHDA